MSTIAAARELGTPAGSDCVRLAGCGADRHADQRRGLADRGQELRVARVVLADGHRLQFQHGPFELLRGHLGGHPQRADPGRPGAQLRRDLAQLRRASRAACCRACGRRAPAAAAPSLRRRWPPHQAVGAAHGAIRDRSRAAARRRWPARARPPGAPLRPAPRASGRRSSPPRRRPSRARRAARRRRRRRRAARSAARRCRAERRRAAPAPSGRPRAPCRACPSALAPARRGRSPRRRRGPWRCGPASARSPPAAPGSEIVPSRAVATTMIGAAQPGPISRRSASNPCRVGSDGGSWRGSGGPMLSALAGAAMAIIGSTISGIAIHGRAISRRPASSRLPPRPRLGRRQRSR